jgi:hypothetical protein
LIEIVSVLQVERERIETAQMGIVPALLCGVLIVGLFGLVVYVNVR